MKMIYSYTKPVLFCLMFSLSLPLIAQIKEQDTSAHRKIKLTFLERLTRKRNFLLAPQLDRSPETGFMSGIYYLQLFKISKDSLTRTSNVETFLSVSEKKQFIAEIYPTLLFKKENYILRSFNKLAKYNEYFYGIGNDISLGNKELIDFNVLETTQRLTRVLKRKFFGGLLYQYYQVWNIQYPENGLLHNSAAFGKEGSVTSGFGPVLLFDSRDNVFNSRKGFYMDISAFFAEKFFGATHRFHNFLIDARKFIPFYRKSTLCFQGIANFNWGDVPFRQLALMGGDVMMRGYYLGTYREHFMLAAQTELRLPLWKFISAVAFGAVAQVQRAIQFFNTADIRYTYGLGLRFMFIRHEGINFGGDVGFGQGTNAFYLGSGESF